mmetsp:Transcript_8016/g.29672  ORF Transcript_8016/g.29672 Transcript_8016/m.29672 type:complete len:241 (-) Transcript_8016:198-920(-)
MSDARRLVVASSSQPIALRRRSTRVGHTRRAGTRACTKLNVIFALDARDGASARIVYTIPTSTSSSNVPANARANAKNKCNARVNVVPRTHSTPVAKTRTRAPRCDAVANASRVSRVTALRSRSSVFALLKSPRQTYASSLARSVAPIATTRTSSSSLSFTPPPPRQRTRANASRASSAAPSPNRMQYANRRSPIPIGFTVALRIQRRVKTRRQALEPGATTLLRPRVAQRRAFRGRERL